MRRCAVVTSLICLAFPMLAAAQGTKLQLPSFAGLQGQATQSVNISIGSLALGAMGWLMDDSDPQSAQVKKAIQGLKSVQVRSYQFNSDFVYSQADVDAVRSQLSRPGWTQLVQVRDRNKQEAVDIYVALDNRQVTGLAIIASEPRELTIVNIAGALDLNQVGKLQKALGLPDAGLDRIPQNVP